MKNEFKNNRNENRISYQKLKYLSNKKFTNYPSLKIVMKKEIKEYENNKHNPHFTRNKLNSYINNFIANHNTLSCSSNYTTSHLKYKNINFFQLNKTYSPFKRKNTVKLNNYTNLNNTENKTGNKAKILKKNSSQSHNSAHLLDLKSKNTLISQNFDKCHLTNISDNFNIKKFKKIKCIKKGNEKFIKDFLYKNLLIKKIKILIWKDILIIKQ